MAMNILKDKKEEVKYVNKVFTKDGYNTINSYCLSLIKTYNSSPQYPIKQGVILGIPMMTHAQIIPTKEALFERIVILSQILGKNEFEYEVDGTIVVFKVAGGF